jgi:hypothetical protein
VRVRRFFKLLVIAVAIITAVTLVGTKLIARRVPTLGHLVERFEKRHDVGDFARRELKQRHRRMDALGKGPLQVCDSILQVQGTKRGSVRKRARADVVDGMTFCAMQANKSQASSVRRSFFSASGFTYA